jgi:transposase
MQACQERLTFRAITGDDIPDFRTISDFRKLHLKELEGLSIQVLQLCQKAGLVKLGHIALDGTKVKANASRHKAIR